MTTLRPGPLSDLFETNDLCPDISAISEENLGNEEISGVQHGGSLEEALKNPNGVSVMQIQVNFPVNSNIDNMDDDKKLSNLYVTLPIGSLVKYSMNYTCRLCAEVIDVNFAINIFSSDQLEENLAYKINKYLPIVVYEADPFPKTICKPCATKINEFHNLVEKCVTVEQELRQTYVFDERYIEELHKKINQKSDSEKFESDNSSQLYPVSDFQYIENLDVSHLNSNFSCRDEKADYMGETMKFEAETEEKKKLEDHQLICQHCNGSVAEIKEIWDHWNRHYGDATPSEFPCLLCEHIDDSKSNLEDHMKTHFKLSKVLKSGNSKGKTKARQPKPLKNIAKACSKLLCCRKCKQTLEGAEDAVEHTLRHKPENVKFYPCVLCISRIGKSNLKEHISMHYPVIAKTVLSCDNCNNLYPDEKTLKYHRCTQLRKYKCSQCNQGFKSEDRLKFHEDFHRNKSTFCDICKKDFKFESRMYLHFAGVHNGIRDKPYCCDVCGKTFTWLTLLNSHKRTHTNERPFKCPKCDARFCNKYSLNGHMPSHEDHPQMHCDKCDYHTGRKQNLQNHISRFHKEISSSQACVRCKICNEIFPNRHHAHVEKHSSKHSEGEINSVMSFEPDDIFQDLTVTKLFQCERCERCFTTVDDLTQHRTSHSSNDVNSFYNCRLCDTSFAKHDLLVKHQKVHVQIISQYTSKLSVLIVISCDICGVECIDYRQLLNHKFRANCILKKITGTLKPRNVLIKKHLPPLKTHQLYVNANGLFECPSCQRTYKNRRRYRLHLATHSNTVM